MNEIRTKIGNIIYVYRQAMDGEYVPVKRIDILKERKIKIEKLNKKIWSL